MRGKGKTNYLKNRLDNVSEGLFIVDIRNEYNHIKAFYKLPDFLNYIFNNQKLLGILKIRFAFQSKREFMKLFTLFESLRNCTIVLDEADALFSVRDFASPLTNVFLGSRNNSVNMIFVAKRPFLIPILIRSQVDEFIIFGTEEKRDIDYLEKRLRATFPKDPFRLDTGEYIVYKQGEKSELKNCQLFTNTNRTVGV